jgi:hypothetical protein
MRKLKRFAGLLLVILIFGLGAFLGARLGPLLGGGSPGRIYNTPTLLKQVQTLSQLVTVQYVLEKAVVWNDPPKTLVTQFFAGENHILILAHGIVKAGVDLSRLTPDDLRIEGDKVIIRLPPAQITDAYLDDTQTKVIERTTGFLRAFDKDLEQTVRQNAVDDIRRAARMGGILKDAEDRARAQLSNLFFELGFRKVDFRPFSAGPIESPFTPPFPETGATTNR